MTCICDDRFLTKETERATDRRRKKPRENFHMPMRTKTDLTYPIWSDIYGCEDRSFSFVINNDDDATRLRHDHPQERINFRSIHIR